jgi:hypothetical protein
MVFKAPWHLGHGPLSSLTRRRYPLGSREKSVPLAKDFLITLRAIFQIRFASASVKEIPALIGWMRAWNIASSAYRFPIPALTD